MSKENNIVIYNDEKFFVDDNVLVISGKSVKDIFEIRGLNNLTNLKVLDLSINCIREIKGLDMLERLEKLYLNISTAIKGEPSSFSSSISLYPIPA